MKRHSARARGRTRAVESRLSMRREIRACKNIARIVQRSSYAVRRTTLRRLMRRFLLFRELCTCVYTRIHARAREISYSPLLPKKVKESAKCVSFHTIRTHTWHLFLVSIVCKVSYSNMRPRYLSIFISVSECSFFYLHLIALLNWCFKDFTRASFFIPIKSLRPSRHT